MLTQRTRRYGSCPSRRIVNRPSRSSKGEMPIVGIICPKVHFRSPDRHPCRTNTRVQLSDFLRRKTKVNAKNAKNSRQLFSVAAICAKLRSASIRLETEHNSRRRLRRMSYGIGVEGAESKVR